MDDAAAVNMRSGLALLVVQYLATIDEPTSKRVIFLISIFIIGRLVLQP